MDENRVSGTARNIGGKIEEGAGAIVGDAKSQSWLEEAVFLR
jgi:uncharacterized protein YjbJ (UPF0337 family)